MDSLVQRGAILQILLEFDLDFMRSWRNGTRSETVLQSVIRAGIVKGLKLFVILGKVNDRA